jgi:N,N-dimethylformamidase
MAATSIHAYGDRMSLTPGETLRVMVSCEGAERYRADLVRLINGDTNPDGPRYKEERIAAIATSEQAARHQPTWSGSHVLINDPGQRLNLSGAFALFAFIWPTTPAGGPQGILAKWWEDRRSGYALGIDAEGRLTIWLGGGGGQVARLSAKQPLQPQVWYAIGASVDPARGLVSLFQAPVVNRVNSRVARFAVRQGEELVEGDLEALNSQGAFPQGAPAPVGPPSAPAPFVIAGWARSAPSGATVVVGHYNGKVDRPMVFARALAREDLEALAHGQEPSAERLVARWDFALGIGPNGIPSDHVADTSGSGLHGTCVNMPARGMTGHNWTAREEHFVHAPEEYGAIHFHDDDLEDSGWETDFALTLPDDLPSDVYAVRLRAEDAEEYVPFFVRPRPDGPRAKILFLVPTASYLAYANTQTAFDGALTQPIVAHTPILNDQDLFLYAHSKEYGLSTYDLHSDGSGVCYSSSLRPILNMRPKYRAGTAGSLWQFPADLHLVDWLNALGHQYDVVTDEDLDREGQDLLRPYRVVLTGSHPEYTSARMLDALEDYVEGGGRLMYLGANGFYWIISFHPDKSHLIEVRKAESGSRAWQARPGEYFHATTGERGGLWRNRGRPPQKVFGVGFTAEGFDESSYYVPLADSRDPRARFIFEGLEADERIGDFGLVGGGAAGYELDRYDLSLGTPPDALLLATSEGHSDGYPLVVEEVFFMTPGLGGTAHPWVRADLVYFTTRSGGAVFSTSSISWCGSLSHDGYRNNVSRITDNVLRRFAGDEPLPG